RKALPGPVVRALGVHFLPQLVDRCSANVVILDRLLSLAHVEVRDRRRESTRPNAHECHTSSEDDRQNGGDPDSVHSSPTDCCSNSVAEMRQKSDKPWISLIDWSERGPGAVAVGCCGLTKRARCGIPVSGLRQPASAVQLVGPS